MNFDSGTAYAESDADDEYERDIHGSSPIATDVENSPIDSDPPSAEHTPTTYGYRSSADRLPETIISEWTAEECADFIASIGVQQYADRFLGEPAPARAWLRAAGCVLTLYRKRDRGRGPRCAAT
jgi:hypothetical protein